MYSCFFKYKRQLLSGCATVVQDSVEMTIEWCQILNISIHNRFKVSTFLLVCSIVFSVFACTV